MNHIQNWTILDLVMVIGSACWLIPQQNTNMCTIECGVVDKIRGHSPIFL